MNGVPGEDVQLLHSQWTCREPIRSRLPTWNGCFSVCSEEVVLNPLPVCTITGDFSICEGESSELCTPLWWRATLMNGARARRPTASRWTCRVFIRSPSPTRKAVSASAAKRSSSTRCPSMHHHRRFLSCEANPASFARPRGSNSTYEWSTGETSNCITVDMPGIYSVTVTDQTVVSASAAKRLSSTRCPSAPSLAISPLRR